jgi:hypothetical protein
MWHYSDGANWSTKRELVTFDASTSTNCAIDLRSIELAMQMSVSEGACALAACLESTQSSSSSSSSSFQQKKSSSFSSHHQRSDHLELLKHLKELVSELGVLEDVVRNHHSARAVAALCRSTTLDACSAEMIVRGSLLLLKRSERRATFDTARTRRFVLSALECCSVDYGKIMRDIGAVRVLANLRFAAGDVESAAMTGRCLKNIRTSGTRMAASNFY